MKLKWAFKRNHVKSVIYIGISAGCNYFRNHKPAGLGFDLGLIFWTFEVDVTW